jgi:hypothetical protein
MDSEGSKIRKRPKLASHNTDRVILGRPHGNLLGGVLGRVPASESLAPPNLARLSLSHPDRTDSTSLRVFEPRGHRIRKRCVRTCCGRPTLIPEHFSRTLYEDATSTTFEWWVIDCLEGNERSFTTETKSFALSGCSLGSSYITLPNCKHHQPPQECPLMKRKPKREEEKSKYRPIYKMQKRKIVPLPRNRHG